MLHLKGHDKDLGGGFIVRRVLPAAARRAVGPFIFFDHFGPVTETPGRGHDVRPHPHIGLATVTYLFEGAQMHRDSVGSVQRIEPGAINWMTAGRGIVHSERKPDDLLEARYVLHGLQLWVALPRAHEEDAPSFVHTPASALPLIQVGAATVRVLVGSAWGQASPVVAHGGTVYLDIRLPPGTTLAVPPLAEELGFYAVDRSLQVDGEPLAPCQMAVVVEGAGARLESGPQGAHVMVLGGDALDAPRHLWWNFVSSRRERLVQAAGDWQDQRMGTVAGETEFIPLPATPLPGTG